MLKARCSLCLPAGRHFASVLGRAVALKGLGRCPNSLYWLFEGFWLGNPNVKAREGF